MVEAIYLLAALRTTKPEAWKVMVGWKDEPGPFNVEPDRPSLLKDEVVGVSGKQLNSQAHTADIIEEKLTTKELDNESAMSGNRN